MSDDGSFRVILNTAQMAAVLTHESLTPAEIMSNRIFGSLRLVGGIIELAGSGVLCALPEPTMISKVGCVAMGVHASDQLAAATNQVVTGEETNSYAFKAGSSAAEALGASRTTGQVIGLATEFVVPLTTASIYNAFRVSSIRAGRMSVITSEKEKHAPNNGPGGHTERDHLYKDVPALQKRLKKFRTAQAMTQFSSMDSAEWAVSQVLKSNRLKIQMYSKAKFLLKKQRLIMTMELNKVVGNGVMRSAPDKLVDMTKVRVIIQFEEYNFMPAYIVTAFPIP
ncbi:RNase A-like domain-containing protein [Pseudomonas syringae group genomosp. 3]|uniref:RNase A-like domain-containing protein n=1 Tax=Pseudomonas syringae group genomosp. 3 TaxID=251701 RepID=UPI0005CB3619|nr:RNase A-like domain-containing protein [Pseudomonas syringae group genomosp. 3]